MRYNVCQVVVIVYGDVYIYVPYSYLPSHYITVTQFQLILTISIAREFATN